MKRHYFISDSLDDLEQVELELEERGLIKPQIHVLSDNESEIVAHHLHPVTDFMKTDVINSGLWGLCIGLIGASLVVASTALMGWAETIGWAPFLFLAIVVLGFCTWEGGFLGFQEKNRRFRRFEEVIRSNHHVLFVDVDARQEPILDSVVARHPRLVPAGDGAPAPGWIISGEQQLWDFMRWAP